LEIDSSERDVAMTATASTPVVRTGDAASDRLDPVEAVDATASGEAAASAVAPVAPAPPSVHVRAVITWIAIFPMVAVGMLLLGPLSEHWHPVLRAFVLTLVVVPLAVYVVVPRLLRAHGAMRAARAARRTGA
jgi:hypothetical protein